MAANTLDCQFDAEEADRRPDSLGLSLGVRLMMGDRTVMQEALFYSFSLEDHVPQSHLLRAVVHLVDLDGDIPV